MQTEREDSGAPECQRREIKIPRKRACRGFYFSRSIRKVNTSLSAIRAHPRYPWLGPLQLRSARGLLDDYPEVRLEISESGHGFMLSFLKVAPQPESPIKSQPEFKLEQRVMALLQSQALGKKQISEVNQKD
jgi:hypothetical protein